MGEEIALGLVCKFWRPVIEFARIETADAFRAFAEPGFAKTVYSLAVRQLEPNKTLLSGLMRTATTDEHARRWFRRFGRSASAPVRTSSSALLDCARGAVELTRTGTRRIKDRAEQPTFIASSRARSTD